ncbi:MAG: cytochrome c oxidase subunit IV [Candidatus Lumbricidophila eiseniae]|uniref:Cytochrome c oxidase polypeptide 4 n=1 Tax=Candidatus Lumbricidiphila eiseniae TaxID=1969409 RepID=A0A2A6FRK6_9MICO|nr:MAG: cytochrome c oxidase subunit IV [Candidatus Lumbricidophila eiseniae]
MGINVKLLWLLTIFLLAAAGVYWLWSAESTVNREPEWAGSIAISLSAVLCAFIGFYLGRVHKAQGAELPGDREHAEIDDGDSELGFFSPWSWWPIALAGSAAIVFLGLAAGFWLCFIGVAFALVSLVGWVFEYYRGNFAR